MRQVTTEAVLTILNNAIENLEITSEQLDNNLSDLGMDSIRFIQIIVLLEEKFKCEIPDAKLLLSEMNTAQKMIDVLQGLYAESII